MQYVYKMVNATIRFINSRFSKKDERVPKKNSKFIKNVPIKKYF